MKRKLADSRAEARWQERRLQSQLRRSGIFVEPMNRESRFEPQRGGIVLTRADAAPTELGPAVEGAWGYKDVAPTELGAKLAIWDHGVRKRPTNRASRCVKDLPFFLVWRARGRAKPGKKEGCQEGRFTQGSSRYAPCELRRSAQWRVID